jgi:hypothetical protein
MPTVMYKALQEKVKTLKQLNSINSSIISNQLNKIEFLERSVNNQKEINSTLLAKVETLELNVVELTSVDNKFDGSVGDFNDYEYSSDGKRMCFINFKTGNVVYACDDLYSKLKSQMLRGEG